eukprot:TRINITY_DN60039_c0_g1_i2.p1 TRINITY_DN60039_c0_g1~~TRINITY_DN60039_c0_g1_i2.p1  ORF type:complete len:202 (-),score=30.55 TRINITY_DN60039_c0_g1_i2:241-846(-)
MCIRDRNKGLNWYGQPVQNGIVVYDGGVEVGVHYKTWVAGCTSPPSKNCRPWRDETRLLVRGAGVEVWNTTAGRFAVYTCSENWPGWNKHQSPPDFVLSPYNCEDSGALNGSRPAATFPCTPGMDLQGCFPQATCDTYSLNAANSRLYGLPSVWADRTGTVYEGSHFIPNLGTAGVTDKLGNVVASSVPGVETILVSNLSW